MITAFQVCKRAFIFLFEHDLRINAPHLSRGKAGSRCSGSCIQASGCKAAVEVTTTNPPVHPAGFFRSGL
jgi:hypothetical protein